MNVRALVRTTPGPVIASRPSTSAAVASADPTPTSAITRIGDVDDALLVDCFSTGRRDFATVLGGLVVGEALLFGVLDTAAAIQPVATAVGLALAGLVGVKLLRRAEETARFGLGAQLVARGVSDDVAVQIVRAERRLGWSYHLRRKRDRAQLLLAEARRDGG